jgi:glutaminyl-tRNA synthetase
MSEAPNTPTNFIRQIIDEDLKSGRQTKVATRFPPEPNGYLHIGHAKSIVLNFGVAEDYNGTCNLRFDDTNPHKEDIEFVQSIQDDVKWLGYQWHDKPYYASNYFDKLYEFAVELIRNGKAYVCELSAEETREYRGTLTEPGRDSPFRNRSVEDNLDQFARMKNGEFEDGAKVLRAKIDMASPNINMRDPTLYRVRRGVIHHQTGEAWCIYPMYDYTHPISDALEGITYSLCTLEFEDHRPLYDWVLDNISIDCHPRQIEFSRLNLEYTVLSKRKLTQLVSEGFVEDWDDPRMPTIAGIRRRGYPPAAIREFCHRIGVTKSEGTVELELLENTVREVLNETTPRRMGVLEPLKVVITNYPEDKVEEVDSPNHPQDESMGTRKIPFCNEIYIEQDDFREEANKKYKRLVKGGLVRLRNAYIIQCDEVIKDTKGELVELHCSHVPNSIGANPEGVGKPRGVIHWVSARHGIKAEVRLYDRLFTHPSPDAAAGKEVKEFTDYLNPESLRTLTQCVLEPALGEAKPGDVFQFERQGYFCADADHVHGRPVFNRTVTLRDTWEKIEQKAET